jgi:hypothetical protein
VYKAAIAPNSRLIHFGLTASVEGKNDDSAFLGAPFLDGTIRLHPLMSASYSLFGWASERLPGSELNVPGTYSPYPDFIPDDANLGDFKLYQNWTSLFAAGKSDFYAQAGISRTSVGPFFDNGTIVGPQAGRAGHLSLNFRQQAWSFEMLFLSLAASNDFGEGTFPEKYLIFHTFNFYPLKYLEFGLQEAVTWGGRFEPLYLFPFTWLFSAQSMGDFSDNSFMGFHVRWSGFSHIQLLAQVYIDDFHFNDFIRFKFNTKYKFAGELGLVWSPPQGLLASLAADYTIVFPYMYSHWNDPDTSRYKKDIPNYQVYSQRGRSLGTDLEPNSYRISLRSTWRTVRNLDVSASAYFTRHGNASDSVSEADWYDPDERHDGSIFDDGDNTKEPNYKKVHFMTQSVIDTRLAAGFGVTWSLPYSFGTFALNAEYVLEYGWNRSVLKNNGTSNYWEIVKNNNGVTHYWSIGGSWRF